MPVMTPPLSPQVETARTPEPRLDSFTSQLTADDARGLVDLLKLAAAGRITDQATPALAQLLKGNHSTPGTGGGKGMREGYEGS